MFGKTLGGRFVCVWMLICAIAMVTVAPGVAAGRKDGSTRAAAKKKKKPCKKPKVRRNGRCVRKPKPKPAPKPTPAPDPTPTPAPDPRSDADGDALPDALEALPTTAPMAVSEAAKKKPRKCTRRQRRHKGRCVPKCRKGPKNKHRHCGKRRKGASAHASSTINLASLGADPNHKDIFVQIDYANESIRQNMSCSDLDLVVSAFASAPVSNPDGRNGINLHIDAGVTCPGRDYDLGGSRIFNAGPCPGSNATFQAIIVQNPGRDGAFHVAGFSPVCGQDGAEGTAAQNGTRLAVFTDGQGFAHVLMHELGHNLGLDHGIAAAPNRFSSMSRRLYASDDNVGNPTEAVDFNRYTLPALDEHNLSEAAGISAPPEAHDFYVLHYCAEVEFGPAFRYAWPADGPIDWNCNSPSVQLPWESPTIDPGVVEADVNGDGQLTVLPATHNEWLDLDYGAGGEIGKP